MTRITWIAVIAIACLSASAARAASLSLNSKSNHLVDFDIAAGFPQLFAFEVRIVSVPGFEFGAGLGAFPINSVAGSLYTYSPIPIDLQLPATFNIYPSGSYSLSGLYGFARWYPFNGGFYVMLSVHSLSLSASISGNLKNETDGSVVPGALAASVGVNQAMLGFGPGYQIMIGEHFHIDFGASIFYLFQPASSTTVGGSISSLAGLSAAAQANYNAAKSNLVGSVNSALSSYYSNIKFAPSAYLELGYIL